MRAGIYLGPGRGGLRRAASTLAWLLIPLTAAHAAVRYGEWKELATRGEIATRDGVSGTGDVSASWDHADRELLARLRAALDVGAIGAVPPTEVLRLLESTLPEGVVLVSVTIEPSPPDPSLMLEAVAESARDVTRLQESVARSARVARTQLLEERREMDGTLSVRLQVDLVEGRLP